jgi:ABC-2 type transport system permease protein
MKRYFKIYLLIIKLNYYKTLHHRAEFLTGTLGALMWGIFNITLIYILSSRSSVIFGWSRAELFVLIGVFNIIVGSTFRLICAENFDRFSSNIQHGDLDSWLVKPIDSQFMLSFLYMKFHNLVRLSLAIIFTIYMLYLAQVTASIFTIMQFIVFSFVGLAIIYSFWYLVMTFAIWFPDLHNLTEILYTTDSLTRYPPQVLWKTGVFLLLVFLPYTLVVSVPTKILLNKATFLDIFILLTTAITLTLLSRTFWKFALRYYTSASG